MFSFPSIILFSFTLVVSANTNASCIIINLIDSFGDGWGDAIWLVESPTGQVHYLSPNCTVNPAVHRLCGKDDGLYYMMVSNDGIPPHSWEILWTVDIESKGDVYTGGFETSMVFEYSSKRNTWAIVYWQKLWTNHQNFTSCGESEYVVSGYCLPSEYEDKEQLEYARHKPTRSPKKSLPSSGAKYAHRGKHVKKLSESRSSPRTTTTNSKYLINTVRKQDTSDTKRFLSGKLTIDKLSKVVSHQPTVKPATSPSKKSKEEKSLTTSTHMGGGKDELGNSKKISHSKTIAKVVSSISSVSKATNADSLSSTGNYTDTNYDLTSSPYTSNIINVPELPDINEEDNQEMESWTDLKVTLFSSSGQGWFAPDYRGTMFYISDESKTILIAYGSLENGTYSAFCEYCFRDGSYTFRVTNSPNDISMKSWSFCNTNGTTSEQLSFHIENGKCVPDALFDVNLVCSKSAYSVVTITGKISLYGVTSEIFSEEDEWALIHSLSSSVYGWNPEFIEIDSIVSNIHIPDLTLSEVITKRELSSFVVDITFSVSFVAEMTYDVDGTNRKEVESLLYEFEKTLTDSMSSGDFTSLMRGLANSAQSDKLIQSRQAELISLEIADITYVGSLPMTISEEINLTEESEFSIHTNNHMTNTTIILHNSLFFITLCIIGFLSLVGVGSLLILMRNNGVSNVTIDSTSESEQDVGEDSSRHPLREMDISNHFKVMRIIKERMSTKL